MNDDVIPFDPHRRRKRQPPAGPTLPDTHRSLSASSRRATPAARELALEQARERRAGYASALSRQETERLVRSGKPVPARITMALNFGEHEGPEVDLAVGTFEGNPDGDVDAWEVAAAVPTAEQVQLLSDLTGFPIAYFYKPIEPGPLLGSEGRMWICYSRKVDGARCHSPEPDWVDEHGVLHYGGEPPRTPPPNQQSALF